MSKHEIYIPPGQQSLLDENYERTLLDQLFADSQLYKSSADYKELLNFVVRLPQFAPFNAMLLQIQKPGLTYAASRSEWRTKFRRQPMEGARPLLILWPFGPVALVYDVLDTEGQDLPQDASSYIATGSIDKGKFDGFVNIMKAKKIDLSFVDAGDAKAGFIKLVSKATKKSEFARFHVCINKNHSPAVQFVTLAHELGHLFLGHLGPDAKLKVPARKELTHELQEIEAESVAFIVCERNGIQSKSHPYLSNFVDDDTSLEDLDVYQIMRAAGQVETLLKLAKRSNFK